MTWHKGYFRASNAATEIAIAAVFNRVVCLTLCIYCSSSVFLQSDSFFVSLNADEHENSQELSQDQAPVESAGGKQT
jgi:hypothetical protein